MKDQRLAAINVLTRIIQDATSDLDSNSKTMCEALLDYMALFGINVIQATQMHIDQMKEKGIDSEHVDFFGLFHSVNQQLLNQVMDERARQESEEGQHAEAS